MWAILELDESNMDDIENECGRSQKNGFAHWIERENLIQRILIEKRMPKSNQTAIEFGSENIQFTFSKQG